MTLIADSTDPMGELAVRNAEKLSDDRLRREMEKAVAPFARNIEGDG